MPRPVTTENDERDGSEQEKQIVLPWNLFLYIAYVSATFVMTLWSLLGVPVSLMDAGKQQEQSYDYLVDGASYQHCA